MIQIKNVCNIKMIDNIFKDLDFISNIKKGEKPCFSDKTCISTNEWFPKLKRRWKNEMGEKGVIYVDTLLNSTSSYVHIYSSQVFDLDNKEEEKDKIKVMREKLVGSLVGLHNLVYTYKIENQVSVSEDYMKATKKVESIILEIDEIIKKFSSSFNDISSTSVNNINNVNNINDKKSQVKNNFFKFAAPKVIKN